MATLLQGIFHFEGIETIGSAFGGIPQGLPTFQLPDLTANNVIELLGPAFTIAMLGAIESLLSAVVADGMAGTRHDSNQELMAKASRISQPRSLVGLPPPAPSRARRLTFGTAGRVRYRGSCIR